MRSDSRTRWLSGVTYAAVGVTPLRPPNFDRSQVTWNSAGIKLRQLGCLAYEKNPSVHCLRSILSKKRSRSAFRQAQGPEQCGRGAVRQRGRIRATLVPVACGSSAVTGKLIRPIPHLPACNPRSHSCHGPHCSDGFVPPSAGRPARSRLSPAASAPGRRLAALSHRDRSCRLDRGAGSTPPGPHRRG